MIKEPEITINGITLTKKQVETFKAALESISADLLLSGIGKDYFGKKKSKIHFINVQQINKLIFKEQE